MYYCHVAMQVSQSTNNQVSRPRKAMQLPRSKERGMYKQRGYTNLHNKSLLSKEMQDIVSVY